MKNIQKTYKERLIKLAGFSLVSLTLLASCGEDKEAYNAWQDKYPYVPCSYDDFTKTKPRGNTCFEKEADRQTEFFIAEQIDMIQGNVNFYQNKSAYIKYITPKVRELYLKASKINELPAVRKKLKDLWDILTAKDWENISDAERKELRALTKQTYDPKQAPKLSKVLKEWRNKYIYNSKKNNIIYPAVLLEDENLFACKDSKDLAKCANDKVQAKFKACFKKAGDNTMAKLGCEQYLKQY